ncbi:MAG: H-NS histone family protein [Gammaproteobacteria bacterium]|nr:H-NS histone family protein [Gammaproteobacteria bacterium]
MTDFKNLSESQLRTMIEKAESVLKDKEVNKRKETLAKIKELAASIGVTVEINEGGKKNARRFARVPIKYRHPEQPNLTWTGRGMTPKWMKELLNRGHDRREFEV